jgi:DNA-binding NtrC family response regulator
LRTLLIDDEQDVRLSLSKFLGKLGHEVVCADDGMAGLREFHSSAFDLVITDIRMPGMDGLELLRRIKTIEKSPVDVIVITGHGDMENAIRALKYGAYDYLQKPINVRELAITIDRSVEYARLRNQYIKLKQEFEERVALETRGFRGETEQLRAAYLEEVGLSGLGVYSEAMRQVICQAEKYSRDRSVPVLIEGESGTGKELVARYIHYYGESGSFSPFVAVNCGAVTQELFEGELFGHEPGAYTGATTRGRMGKLEAAHGGTIFLDEVGETPFAAQVKLLRVLEEKRLYRVGGVTEIPVDIRVISATNKDLEREVAENRFRLDLFYRINTGRIEIPPLRQRKDDILPLALKFAERAYARHGRRFSGFTPKAERFLLSFEWPGNVRQVKNVMERLALLLPDDRVDHRDLSSIADLQMTRSAPSFEPHALDDRDFELPAGGLDLESLISRIIAKALERHQGNQTNTALYLGISRRVLQGRLKKAFPPGLRSSRS